MLIGGARLFASGSGACSVTEVTAIRSMVTANAVKFEFSCQNEYKKTNLPPMRIGKMWWRQQDSSISGARLLASGSGACSVTEATAKRSMVAAGEGKYEARCRHKHKKSPTV